MAVLTTSISDATLQKVMRFTSAREIWQELHKLYDGVSEDKAYTLCDEFFAYKPSADGDMASHISTLTTIWSKLQTEVVLLDPNITQLPEILLLCKILGTLPEAYFSFKASWLMMQKSERTLDNLTNQLCA